MALEAAKSFNLRRFHSQRAFAMERGLIADLAQDSLDTAISESKNEILTGVQQYI